MSERLTLTVEEAAQLLGIGRTAAYDAARRGELPAIRIGRRLLVPRHQLERLLGLPVGGEATEEGPSPARQSIDERHATGQQSRALVHLT